MGKWDLDRVAATIEAVERLANRHPVDAAMARSHPKEAARLNFMLWWRVCCPESRNMKRDLRAYLKHLNDWPKSERAKKKPGRRSPKIVVIACKMRAMGRMKETIATRCIKGYRNLNKDGRAEAWRKLKERMDNHDDYKKKKEKQGEI